MPGLLALHHGDILDGVVIATAGSCMSGCFLARFSPQVCLSDVMVVRNGDGRTVLDDIPELQTKFNPARSMFSMMVSLITGKEKKVGVDFFNVLHDVSSWTWVPAGIAGQIAHDDFIFVDGVFSNRSGKDSFLSMSDAVGKNLGVVPVRNSEVGTPSWVSDCD